MTALGVSTVATVAKGPGPPKSYFISGRYITISNIADGDRSQSPDTPRVRGLWACSQGYPLAAERPARRP